MATRHFPARVRATIQGQSHDQELARLRRENALLRQERDILKKAMEYFASAPR